MPNNVSFGVQAKGVKKASNELEDLRGKFDKLKSQGAKGFAIGAGFTAATKGLELVGDAAGMAADFIGDSINAARDLHETLSKSTVVFGDYAGQIETWGETAAEAMGLSKQEAIEAAATFGGLFQEVGQSRADAVEMSQTLVQLAGDLASFNNIDPSEALQKLRSGLAGEAEPLRSMNVFLNEAAVKAKAMEMGLGDAHGELTDGEKILARYKLIMEQTMVAQGDYARTADGLANSQRTANKKLIDAQAQLGESFEPIALGVTEAQIAVVDWFRSGVEGWQMLGDAFSGGAKTVETTMDYTADAVERTRGSVARNLDKMGDATTALRRTTKSDTELMSDYWDSLTQSIQDNVDELQTEAFDPLEARLDEQQQHFKITAAIEARESAKGKEAVVDANAEIVASIDDQVDNLQNLGKHHKLTAKDVDKFEDDVEKSFKAMGKKVPPEIRSVITELRKLAKYDGKTVDVKVVTTWKNRYGGKANQYLAGGGYTTGGTTMVGEEGPELVRLPVGSQVFSANSAETKGAMRGGSTYNYNVTVMGDIRARDKTELLRALSRLSSISQPMQGYGVF